MIQYPDLYLTFHGEHLVCGAAFASRQEAEQYRGPFGYELCEAKIVSYVR